MHEDQQLYGRLDRIDEKLGSIVERLPVLEEQQRRVERSLEKHEGLLEGHANRLNMIELSHATASTAAAGRWGFASKLGWAVLGVLLATGGSLASKGVGALMAVLAK